jgi:hypothetical protein
MKWFGLVLPIVAAAALFACAPREPIVFDGQVFEARGWSGEAPEDGWESVFAVYAGEGEAISPMAGAYAQRNGTIIFTPAFPPAPGLALRAVFRQPGGQTARASFTAAAIEIAPAPTSITALYPSTEAWPENILKFNIHFSQPMMRGVAYEHIKLLNEQGREVESPFARSDEEQWNPEMTRLTVSFAPGRIEQGQSYTLVVDDEWPDAGGTRLTGELRKPITAVEAVREPVDPSAWRIRPPATRTDPLVVVFPRPMDRALARRVLSVEGVPGQVRLENQERRWVFTPQMPWRPGEYQLRVDGALEDLAGNRLHRVFGAAIADPDQAEPPQAFEFVPFTVGG